MNDGYGNLEKEFRQTTKKSKKIELFRSMIIGGQSRIIHEKKLRVIARTKYANFSGRSLDNIKSTNDKSFTGLDPSFCIADDDSNYDIKNSTKHFTSSRMSEPFVYDYSHERKKKRFDFFSNIDQFKKKVKDNMNCTGLEF